MGVSVRGCLDSAKVERLDVSPFHRLDFELEYERVELAKHKQTKMYLFFRCFDYGCGVTRCLSPCLDFPEIINNNMES